MVDLSDARVFRDPQMPANGTWWIKPDRTVLHDKPGGQPEPSIMTADEVERSEWLAEVTDA